MQKVHPWPLLYPDFVIIDVSSQVFAVTTTPSLDVISSDPSPTSRTPVLALMIMATGAGK